MARGGFLGSPAANCPGLRGRQGQGLGLPQGPPPGQTATGDAPVPAQERSPADLELHPAGVQRQRWRALFGQPYRANGGVVTGTGFGTVQRQGLPGRDWEMVGQLRRVDWGVSETATTTDPDFDLPHAQHGKRAASRLAHYQRQMARRKPRPGRKASAGYRRTRANAAKILWVNQAPGPQLCCRNGGQGWFQPCWC
jgi:hypothetical protein